MVVFTPIIINTLISIEMISDYYNNYLIVFAGDSSTRQRLIPDLTLQYSWFIDTSNYKNKSERNGNKALFQYNYASYNSSIIEEKIYFDSFDNSTLHDYLFQLVAEREMFFTQYTQGGIG